MSNEDNLLTKFDNTIACEAIVEKLSDVSRVAESLDNVLRGTQTSLDAVDSNNNTSACASGSPVRKISSNNNSDVNINTIIDYLWRNYLFILSNFTP